MTRPLRRLLHATLRRLGPDRERRARQRLRRLRRPAFLGTARLTAPLSRDFGYDRGTPVDRYYVERFLGERRDAITGHVLEVKDSGYTTRLGTGVTQADVLDIDPANEQATIVGDLQALDGVADETFDCFVLTQTLQFVYDLEAAIGHAHRILRPGGTLLVTVPVVSRVITVPGKLDDYWRFTQASCARLFARFAGVEVVSYGNVFASKAFLRGIAHEELRTRDLDRVDPDYATLIGIAARK
jgi:SAM-dependent methyltransferase